MVDFFEKKRKRRRAGSRLKWGTSERGGTLCIVLQASNQSGGECSGCRGGERSCRTNRGGDNVWVSFHGHQIRFSRFGWGGGKVGNYAFYYYWIKLKKRDREEKEGCGSKLDKDARRESGYHNTLERAEARGKGPIVCRRIEPADVVQTEGGAH